ncbi:alpha/beta hydrolase [Streptomyces pathocidini]|uniref:Alpha/beta hydrolase n=1 Tax=Streptomyces pathocidini TaxID=1650571 RepID=A0ABW7URI5_9ACTN|nr:alpha/beta hydrolase [Streptomyces pathocidini]
MRFGRRTRPRHKGKRLQRTMLAGVIAAAVVTGTAGWAAGQEQTAVTGTPPGAAAWQADAVHGQRLPDPASVEPADVARFFAGLSTEEQRALAVRHPLVVGNLDGAPVALRYAANARAIAAERDRQRARAKDPALTSEDHRTAHARAMRCAELLAPGRQFLAFDPRGRGQVAEVYGDLANAGHVAVVVPGSDIDLATSDRRESPGSMAKSLLAQANRQAPESRTAVVAWTGYTTPVGLGPDAATGRLAEAGAPRLERFLAGLAAVGAPAPTVFCHSYGSVVCGLAAPELSVREASDLVVFGSPGMRADTAADLGTGARVWAARDTSDWIRHVPNVDVLGLGHGEDPTEPSFGARVVSSTEAEGHTGYFAPGTDALRNFTAITLGRFGEVSCAADGSRGCTDGLR